MRKRKEQAVSFCEISGARQGKGGNRTRFYRHKGGCQWQGVKDEKYKTAAGAGGWSDVVRRVIIGNRGESAKFHVRYFEIAPGGASSLETHRHEHAVICVKGGGVVRTGRAKREMRFMDAIYISPGTVHQLLNPSKKPFGFICVVNAKRDRPKVIDRRS